MFIWVPGHVRIIGNEIVDRLSKEAATSSENALTYSTQGDWYSMVKHEMCEKWQGMWNVSENGRFCHSVLPNMSLKPWFINFPDLDRGSIVKIYRLLSGHTKCKAHLFRINCVESPLCDNCDVLEDVNHIFFGCAVFREGRSELLNKLGFSEENCNVGDALKKCIDADDSERINAVIEYIRLNNISL